MTLSLFQQILACLLLLLLLKPLIAILFPDLQTDFKKPSISYLFFPFELEKHLYLKKNLESSHPSILLVSMGKKRVPKHGSSYCGSAVMNQTSVHEDLGSIPVPT